MSKFIPWAIFLMVACFCGQPPHAQEREFTGSTVFNYQNYADNAPGTAFLERGNRFYRRGDYEAAVGNFQLASHWADKMAQFNLGMLYVNGQGVERDPLRGWAWIELSAEREYPANRQVADEIWSQFSDEHRQMARKILEEELKPRFGDDVAIDRTSRDIIRNMRRKSLGGSRVGANRVTYVEDRAGNLIPGDVYYHRDRWDFEKIVAFETRLFKTLGQGVVTLGELKLIDDEEDAQGEEDRDSDEDGNGDG
ncbi:MAG: hypothetical protein ACNA7E_00945 [Wenzhouxiangellaceae bacterium]